MMRLSKQQSEQLKSATKFIRDICQEQEKFFESKPDSWQESEHGEEYQEWMDSWCEILDGIEDMTVRP